MKIGDKVCYNRAFLKSSGSMSGPVPFARGTIKDIILSYSGVRLALVDWGKDDWMPERVNIYCLAVVDPEKGIIDEY